MSEPLCLVPPRGLHRRALGAHLARAVTIGLWALVAALTVRVAPRLVVDATRPSAGFVAYYTAARLLSRGADPAGFYDDTAFSAQVRRTTPDVSDIFNVNPPTTSLLLLPFAGLSYVRARVGWTIVSLIFVAAACAALLNETRVRGVFLPAALAVVLVFQPLAANLAQGQAYGFLLALLTLAWVGLRRGRDGWLGVPLGLAAVLKSVGGPVWLLLLVVRRWRALVWALSTGLFVILVSLPWLGAGSWRTYLELVPGLASRPSMAVTAYQSFPGLFRHLLTTDARWNPAPLVEAPRLAAVLTVALAATLIVVSLRAAYVSLNSDSAFASFVLIGLVLTPYSLDYHYTLALLPIFLLLGHVQERRSPLAWVALAAATALIAADLPYRSPRLAAGALALLAYPKLAGACLLWGLSVWISGHRRTAQAAP